MSHDIYGPDFKLPPFKSADFWYAPNNLRYCTT